MSKKHKLTEELHRLEDELENLGGAVSESQIWHKKARIDAIKKELAELDSPAAKFNAGTEKLNEMMAQNQNLTPEQLAAIGAGRE